MSERKNIERLFQEKFKDFEETPSSKVWENIQSKLEKKENKRRVVPFWIKASGIAAIMVLGFFTADYYNDVTPSDSFDKSTKIVVSSESSDKNNNPNETVNSVGNNSEISNKNAAVSNIKNENNANSLVYDKTKDNKTLNQNNAVVVGNNSNSSSKSFNSSTASSDKNSKNNDNSLVYDKANANKSLDKNKAVVVGNNPKSSSKSFNTSLTSSNKNKIIANEKNQISTSNPTLVSSEKTNESNMSSSNKHQNSKRTNPKKQFLPNPTNGVAAISPFKKLEGEKANTSPAKENEISPIYNNNQRKFVVQNNTSEKPKSEENSTQNPNKGNVTNNNLINSDQNNVVVNGINPNKTPSEKINKDSIAVAAVEENPLDKILKEKQEPKKQETLIAEKTSQWKIRPNVAPIFMNAAKGSPIDEQFADNTKDFENNFSVGLGVDFALNSKLSIRTGIHKFEMAYNTNDIEYYADLNGSRSSGNSLETINREPEARMIVVEDKNVIRSEQFSVQELATQSTNEGYLNQKIGYIEVPFEMSYKLIDRKFGIELISGLSTLFLNENEVSVVSEGLTTVLGEANNLNKIHFSANIGVGFKYNFWKSFEANFEPTFKYQMNSFNANAGGFKPYLIGLYTGLSFKF
jgi:hypothetical protein